MGSKIAARRLEEAKKKWMELKTQKKTLTPVPPPLPKYEMPPLKTLSISDEIKQIKDNIIDSSKKNKKINAVDIVTKESNPSVSLDGKDTDSKCADAKNAFHSFFDSTLKKQNNGMDSSIGTSTVPLTFATLTTTTTSMPFGTGSFSSSTTNSNSNNNATTTTNSNMAPTTKQMESIKTDDKNYKERLLEFYTKYNPEKLSSVDETLEKYKGKEEEMFTKLYRKYTSSGLPPPMGTGPKVFMDITIGGEDVGRIVYMLYQDKTKKTADNFYYLCTGEKGKSKLSSKVLSYKNSSFHRVVPGFVIQGGDFTKHNGTGGESIYGGTADGDMWGKFKDEMFMSHSKKYLLSMANSGKDTNSSQFFITLKEKIGHLDGKHVVFGEVVDGFEVVDRIVEKCVLKGDKPTNETKVMIVDCGKFEGTNNDVLKEELTKTKMETKHVSASAAFPPMSFKAPTPFSAASGKSSTTTATTGTSTSSSTSAAFPPMSFKAPTPFSAASGKSSTTVTTGTSTSSSTSAAFPPVSFKAPTPFSAPNQPLSESGTNRLAVAPISSSSPKSDAVTSSESSQTKSSKDASANISNPFANINLTTASSTGASNGGFIFGFQNDKKGNITSLNTGFNFKLNPPNVDCDLQTQDNKDFSKIAKEDVEVSTSKQNIHASRAYDAIDIDKVGELPISKLENLLDEVGEGFHGDELEKQIQLLDAKGTGIIKRSAFIQWYCNLDGAGENDDGSLDTEERKEREEERLKASETYEKLASNGVILANDFGKLIEAMGTTYCEEEHKCTVRKISENGVISKNAFMNWYMDWLFGDNDYSDFEDGSDSYDSNDESDSDDSETFSNNDSSESTDNENNKAMDSTNQGWGNTFSVEKDSWKCEVCMVQNSGKSIKCLACETLKPGCEDVSEVKDDTSKVNSTPFTFSFMTKTETSTTPTFSFGFNPPPSAPS